MARVYKCDACGKIIRDPYTQRVKEFKLKKYETGYVRIQDNTKVHLCGVCFHSLRKIATESEDAR